MQKILDFFFGVELIPIQFSQIFNTEIYWAFSDIRNDTDSITVEIFNIRCLNFESEQFTVNGIILARKIQSYQRICSNIQEACRQGVMLHLDQLLKGRCTPFEISRTLSDNISENSIFILD